LATQEQETGLRGPLCSRGVTALRRIRTCWPGTPGRSTLASGPSAAITAVTLYLEASQSGGELDVWDQRPHTEQTVTRETKEIDAYDSDLLGEPAVILAASAGDLLIYDNRNVHSTRPDPQGLQVTVSVIIGYRSATEPLSVWS
jgi:hypothetical protein